MGTEASSITDIAVPTCFTINRLRSFPVQFSDARYANIIMTIQSYIDLLSGFTLLAINFFATGRDLLGAFCFVLSLGFKQMALYYAPAIGSYLLAKCIYLGPAEGYAFVLLSVTNPHRSFHFTDRSCSSV